jgi:acetyl-CoA C-acetyltransferase
VSVLLNCWQKYKTKPIFFRPVNKKIKSIPLIKQAYIVDIIRTPIGKYAGALSSIRPDDLAALVIRELLNRTRIDPFLVEEVIFGAANQSGEDNRNVGRMAALLAGLPLEVAGVTVNRLCASGLQSIMNATQGIQCGLGSAYLAGGVESMSRAPFVLSKSDQPFSRKSEMFDTTLGWRFTNDELAKKYHPFSMGETAENVAGQWKISRQRQDEFAFHSQLKYDHAFKAGKFSQEIIGVSVVRGNENTRVETDEHPRLTTLEKLASLKPAFKADGTVTAGNSSGINDGAACALVTDEDTIKKYSFNPLARVVSMAVAGVDPSVMGIGPVPATKKALLRAGLKMSDIGLVELNEAFASQSIACLEELGIDPEIVNPNGGAIALGHPLGCSGTRISATLLYEMKRQNVRYGLATMCVGVGQGAAIIYENIT